MKIFKNKRILKTLSLGLFAVGTVGLTIPFVVSCGNNSGNGGDVGGGGTTNPSEKPNTEQQKYVKTGWRRWIDAKDIGLDHLSRNEAYKKIDNNFIYKYRDTFFTGEKKGITGPDKITSVLAGPANYPSNRIIVTFDLVPGAAYDENGPLDKSLNCYGISIDCACWK